MLPFGNMARLSTAQGPNMSLCWSNQPAP